MEIIIGNDDCSIKDLCKQIGRAPAAEMLYENWVTFARELELRAVDITELRKLEKQQGVHPDEIMFQLVTRYCGVNGKDALLSDFIDALEECSHQSVADILQSTFIDDESDTDDEEGNDDDDVENDDEEEDDDAENDDDEGDDVDNDTDEDDNNDQKCKKKKKKKGFVKKLFSKLL